MERCLTDKFLFSFYPFSFYKEKKEKDKTKEAKETSDWGLEIAGKLEQTSRPQELRDLFPSG